MDSITEYLIKLSDRLDGEGKTVCADAVDQLIETGSLTKVAQYVGAIGYVLKQNRAMGNCIRKKRVESSSSMQEVVMECLKEYQDGQDYHDTEWTSKYASKIENQPSSFDVAHLELLASIGQESHLDADIDRVEKTASVLNQHRVSDEMIDQALSNLQSLGEILKREAANQLPFKLAAPAKNWWSRIWNPSQFSWYNPMSWNQTRRWRGEDKETLSDLDDILERIMNITTTSQRMRTSIYRLQNQVAGYLSGSSSQNMSTDPMNNLPQRDHQDAVASIVQQIKQLSPKDWNRSILALHQLQNQLKNHIIYNDYNRQHLELADNLTQDLVANADIIYKDVDQIQRQMNSLRQRGAVRGRDFGIYDTGESNPRAQISPAEEFGALERVLNRLYQNPFDENAHFYAQKMHARLEDKLRYIERDVDQDTSAWMGSENQQTPYHDTQTQQGQPSPQQQEVKPVDATKIEAAADQLLSLDIPGIDDPGQKAEFIATILTTIFDVSGPNGLGNSETRGIVKALKDRLMRNVDINAVPTSSSVTEETPTNENPAQEADGGAGLEDSLYSSGPGYDDDNELPQSKVSRSDVLVKIADVLDRLDTNVADIIDQYIEENAEFNIDFPAFSRIIKEN